MSDTQYKKTVPGAVHHPANSAALSYPSELLRPPAEASALSVDSNVVAGRRVLLSRHTGGAHEFLVDSTATGGATQAHPDADTWRRVGDHTFEQAPGTALEVRMLGVPSGASEFFNLATWDLSGVGGQTRVIVTWTSLTASVSTTVTRTFDGDGTPDGQEPVGAGSQWAQLQHEVAAVVRPPGMANELDTAEDYSEWTSVRLQLQDRGGARVVHVSVSEVPADHVVLDTETSTDFTGSAASWETNRPQVEAPDGATHEEHRYGSSRAMNTTARQSERVGPIIYSWSAYDERSATVTQTDPPGKTTSLATFVRLGPGRNTAWDVDEVGTFVMGTQRAPEHLSTRISGASSVPVLIRVMARFSGAGAGSGVVRFATTERSYVDVPLDQAAIGSTWTEVKARGWLEASVASDDWHPKLQVFFKGDGVATVEARGCSVNYGDYATGA